MSEKLYICSACHIDVCEHTKEHIVKLENEIDKYQDKVYHSTRLIEQLEHELELLRKVVKLQREGLEMYANSANWDLDQLINNDEDVEEINIMNIRTEFAAGKRARQTLKEVDELLKG